MEAIRKQLFAEEPIQWPTVSNEPLFLATIAFPTLLPDGKGDPTNQALLKEFPLHERSKHLLKFAENIDGNNLNARSIKSKSADFLCSGKLCAADIFTITETWFTERDSAHRGQMTPPGYMLYDLARSGHSGGGRDLLCRDSISVTRITGGEEKVIRVL